ncbi:MAG: hypothetical protein ABIQ39_16910 [Ilumatobacteraceae bacterium]
MRKRTPSGSAKQPISQPTGEPTSGISGRPTGETGEAKRGTTPWVDPVRARRQKVAHWTLLANRIGYLLFAVAIATFVIGFALGFNGAVATIVLVSMVVGSILLAPAIVLGYGVKAAERDDREHGR